MNENKFKKGIDELKNLSLSENEKNTIRHNLSMYADFNLPAKKSPFNIFSISSNKRLLSLIASSLVVLLTCSGVAFASENSLPGDILYSVKINITEPIREAMATTPLKKAIVHAKLAERRLSEAEKLFNEGKLSTSTTENIKKDFEKHAAKFTEYNKESAGKNNDVDVNSDDNQRDFDKKLSNHSAILSKINSIQNKELPNINQKDNVEVNKIEQQSKERPGATIRQNQNDQAQHEIRK